MNNNQSIIDFNNLIRGLLLKSLYLNKSINEPTYKRVLRKYENVKGKEVA